VAALVVRCNECGFENPRRWVSCARCGLLLGPGIGLGTLTSSAPTTDVTRHVPVSEVIEPPEHEDDDHTRLFHSAATSADARPVVGQQAAQLSMRQNIDAAFAQRRVTLTFVEGGPGTGRTRLLERASEIAARQWLSARVMYAACRSRDEGPYAPFSRWLIERFGVTPASSPSQVRGEMLSSVADVLPGSSADDARDITHLLGHIAGVPFPSSALLSSLESAPLELIERACTAVACLLEGDARNRPMLLLLDDMQRAESEAWHVLEALLSVQAPLAIIVSGDETVAAQVAKLSPLAPTVTARLRPLGDAEVSELVIALVPGLRHTPESFVEALRHRSRGNPSTLKELVRVLDERGLFKRTSAGIELDLPRFERGDLPLTMADAVRARLAALDPFERTVMEWAAVVGEMFWEGALLAIGRSETACTAREEDPILRWTEGQDEIRLFEALRRLEYKRFIVRIAESQLPGLSEYTFHVAGARGVIYGELDEELRKQRHGIVARWMTLASHLPEEGLAASLGQHLERAGQPVRAAQAYLKASSEERSRLRTTMALRYASKALSLAGTTDFGPRLEALHEHGSLLTTLGRYDEAYASFKELVDLAWQLGARGPAGAALNRLARIHRQRGEHPRALEYLRCALLLFRAAEDERGVASTYDDLAQVHRTLGNLEPALSAAREALASRRASSDARGEAVSLTTIGFIELDQGDFESAENHFSAALGISKHLADHEGAIQTQIGLGKLAFYQGRTADAAALYSAALDSAREMNNRRFQSHLLNHLAETRLALGQSDAAHALLHEARGLALSLRDQRALSEIEHNLGLLALQRSDPAAEQQLTAALALAHEYGTREAIAFAQRGIARMRAQPLFDQTGRTMADAEESFRESIRVFDECGNVREAARTRAELGYHLIERGAAPRGKEALSEAYAAMKRLSLPDLTQVAETLEHL
jgi:tetratricopeptide (TPR) repeat protein